MKHDHEKRRGGRVAEPVQVYLDRSDRDRLDRLTERLDTTKSDVLRRGLEALEALTTERPRAASEVPPLPTFGGSGLQPGVDLDDTASLIDLMNQHDASG